MNQLLLVVLVHQALLDVMILALEEVEGQIQAVIEEQEKEVGREDHPLALLHLWEQLAEHLLPTYLRKELCWQER